LVNEERLTEPRELKVFNRIRAGQVLFVFDKQVVTPQKKQDTTK
jgi:hypothetical protein